MSRRGRSDEADVVRTWVGGPWRPVLVVVAAIYLVGVAVSTSELGSFDRVVPGWLGFFTQLAALFVKAADTTIEYRVEGWSCRDRRWEEIDTRPVFRMRPNDKENRFQRLAHFYRSDAQVMSALADFLLPRVPWRAGGIRVLSLRIPFGAPGAGIERYQRKALTDYPDEIRHTWYETPARERVRHCAEGASP